VLGEAEPLAEDCLVPTPAPESTKKVCFVFTHFCLPSGIPSASEGAASHLLFSPGWGTCHLACLLFLLLALLERAPGMKQDSFLSQVAIFSAQTRSVS